tara:strand:+ start:501 stop:1118 length:618 start_codon:yes stop_codon:yes gene_type:complete
MTGIVAQNVGRTSGLIKAASGGGGVWTLIKTVTASSSATITFINGTSDVVLDSTYPTYVIKYINVHPSNQSSLTMNLTIDGSNWNVSKTTTCIECYNWENGSTPVLAYRDLDLANGTGEQNLMVGLGTDNDENGCGEMWLFNPSSTTFVKHFIIDTNFMENQGLCFRQPVAGYANTTSAVTGVRFIMAAGTIDSGTFKLYGLGDS